MHRSRRLFSLCVCAAALPVSAHHSTARFDAGRAGAAQAIVAACGPQPTGDTVFEPRGPGRAEVLCGSVERVANHAIRLRNECALQEQSWTCRGSGKELPVAVNGRDVMVLFPVDLNSWSAWQMVQAIAPMTVPAALPGRRGPRDIQDRCMLAGDNSDARVARMTLRCQLWTVEFVKLCGPSGCRFEPAARLGSGGGPERRRRREAGPPKPTD